MDPPMRRKLHRFPLWPQWLAAAEVFLMATTLGLSAGWVSPYLAKLSKPDSQPQISKEDASWIASIVCITAPVGAGLQTTYVNYMGSKSSTLMCGVVYALGWMCFFIENSVTSIFAYRILAGIGAGMMYSAFPLYIGEMSDPKIRGALVSFILQGTMVGILIGNIMGAYLNTWVFAAIALVPNLLFVALFVTLPHTPHHLLRNNKLKEAAESIKWYNRNADVDTELIALKKIIQNTPSSSYANRLRDLMNPTNRRAFTMLLFLYAFSQLSGLHTVSAYMEIMFTKARVTVVAPATMVMIVSTLGIVSCWMSIFTNDKFGRTIMFALSSIGVATGLFLWGLNFQLLDLGFDNPHLQWMALIAAVLYKTSLAAGLLTIPSTLMSELFAPNVKSLGASIINIFSTLFAFIGSKTYQPMVDSMTEKYVFWIYAALMISAAVYIMIFVPETKGKTLAEIQDILAVTKTNGKANIKANYESEGCQLLELNKDSSKLPVV